MAKKQEEKLKYEYQKPEKGSYSVKARDGKAENKQSPINDIETLERNAVTEYRTYKNFLDEIIMPKGGWINDWYCDESIAYLDKWLKENDNLFLLKEMSFRDSENNSHIVESKKFKTFDDVKNFIEKGLSNSKEAYFYKILFNAFNKKDKYLLSYYFVPKD